MRSETTEARHPLLEREGIDDAGLSLDFGDFMVGMVAAPDLTYQYNERGELSASSLFTTTPLCEDAPAIYRERFVRGWMVTGRIGGKPDLDGEACWARLRELVSDQLKRLPDNPHVLEDAWLAGLVDEMPPRFRSMLAGLHGRIEAYRKEKAGESTAASRARETNTRQVLRGWTTDRCHNRNDSECSFDHATEYVLPDGSRKVEYVCCF